jgi:hypothetical protein
MTKILTCAFILLVISAIVYSEEYYKWTDSKGIIHFVNSPNKIPKEGMIKAKRIDIGPDYEGRGSLTVIDAKGKHDEMGSNNINLSKKQINDDSKNDKTEKDRSIFGKLKNYFVDKYNAVYSRYDNIVQ